MAKQQSTQSESSLASLVGEIVSDATTLLRQEFALARLEMAGELQKTKDVAVSFGLGTALLLLGGGFLLLMVVFLLAWAFPGLPLWACFGLVGAALVLAGVAALLVGRGKARDIHWLPPQTAETMKENAQWIKTYIGSDAR